MTISLDKDLLDFPDPTEVNFKPLVKTEISFLDKESNRIGLIFFDDQVKAAAAVSELSKSVELEHFGKFSFIPAPAKNVEQTFQHVFFPNLFIDALKIESVATRIFAIIFSVIFDLITLIPRLLITPFKYIYDAATVKLPVQTVLSNYLGIFPSGKEAMEAGHIFIQIKTNTVTVEKSAEADFEALGILQVANNRIEQRIQVVYTNSLAREIQVDSSNNRVAERGYIEFYDDAKKGNFWLNGTAASGSVI